MFTRYSLLIILFALISVLISEGSVDQPQVGSLQRVTVNITNGLAQDLWLHCKSKDDDLGPKTLKLGQAWWFSFRLNFFETTLFFCNFRWASSTKDHRFDIYDANQIATSECKLCTWRILESGPCLWIPYMKGYTCSFNWKPDL